MIGSNKSSSMSICVQALVPSQAEECLATYMGLSTFGQVSPMLKTAAATFAPEERTQDI